MSSTVWTGRESGHLLGPSLKPAFTPQKSATILCQHVHCLDHLSGGSLSILCFSISFLSPFRQVRRRFRYRDGTLAPPHIFSHLSTIHCLFNQLQISCVRLVSMFSSIFVLSAIFVPDFRSIRPGENRDQSTSTEATGATNGIHILALDTRVTTSGPVQIAQPTENGHRTQEPHQ